MLEILRTNDPIIISVVEALLKETKIYYIITDTHTSILKGSLSFIRRRIFVNRDKIDKARQLIKDVGLGNELYY